MADPNTTESKLVPKPGTYRSPVGYYSDKAGYRGTGTSLGKSKDTLTKIFGNPWDGSSVAHTGDPTDFREYASWFKNNVLLNKAVSNEVYSFGDGSPHDMTFTKDAPKNIDSFGPDTAYPTVVDDVSFPGTGKVESLVGQTLISDKNKTIVDAAAETFNS